MTDYVDTKPSYWDEAVTHLMRRDRILRKVIPPYAHTHLTAPLATPFHSLARAVLGQQISVKAADAIWQRLNQTCDMQLAPAAITGLGVEGLRTVGLSQRKAEYVLDLARHFSENLLRSNDWPDMEDEAIITELTAIRGIGRWTAEMFLIFNLRRPDVLPLDDLGLMKAISLLYFSGEPVSRFEAREVAQAWQPWSTVASWYLWRSLNPVAVEH